MSRIFLLSPAYAGGQRARMIMSERAEFELARRLRSENRPTLGEVFTFLSGLYFRGKIAYATTFARATNGSSGVLVITPTRGLVDATTRIGLADFNHPAHFQPVRRSRTTALHTRRFTDGRNKVANLKRAQPFRN